LEIEKAIDIASILTGVTSGLFQIAVNNLSYNKERAASYLYSYPYNDIAYMFITGPDAQPIRTFEEAAGKSIEGSSGGAILTAIETWNEEHPDKKINIKYTEGDTSVGMLHVEDGTTDFMIIDVAMYNNYLKEFNYNVVATELSKEEAAHISNSTYTYFLLAQSDAELRDIIDEVLKKIKQDGTLAKINAKYFGGDYTPAADQYEKTLN
jgi:polar amino acid transport system substrate-binding protein